MSNSPNKGKSIQRRLKDLLPVLAAVFSLIVVYALLNTISASRNQSSVEVIASSHNTSHVRLVANAIDTNYLGAQLNRTETATPTSTSDPNDQPVADATVSPTLSPNETEIGGTATASVASIETVVDATGTVIDFSTLTPEKAVFLEVKKGEKLAGLELVHQKMAWVNKDGTRVVLTSTLPDMLGITRVKLYERMVAAAPAAAALVKVRQEEALSPAPIISYELFAIDAQLNNSKQFTDDLLAKGYRKTSGSSSPDGTTVFYYLGIFTDSQGVTHIPVGIDVGSLLKSFSDPATTVDPEHNAQVLAADAINGMLVARAVGISDQSAGGFANNLEVIMKDSGYGALSAITLTPAPIATATPTSTSDPNDQPVADATEPSTLPPTETEIGGTATASVASIETIIDATGATVDFSTVKPEETGLYLDVTNQKIAGQVVRQKQIFKTKDGSTVEIISTLPQNLGLMRVRAYDQILAAATDTGLTTHPAARSISYELFYVDPSQNKAQFFANLSANGYVSSKNGSESKGLPICEYLNQFTRDGVTHIPIAIYMENLYATAGTPVNVIVSDEINALMIAQATGVDYQHSGGFASALEIAVTHGNTSSGSISAMTVKQTNSSGS